MFLDRPRIGDPVYLQVNSTDVFTISTVTNLTSTDDPAYKFVEVCMHASQAKQFIVVNAFLAKLCILLKAYYFHYFLKQFA